MITRLKKKIAARRFDAQIGGILDTPPIEVKDAPWCVVSMVAKHDISMYLLAIKSFYRRLGRGKIVAIIDRDTPREIRDTLAHHIVGIEFVILETIPTGHCQRGGTWERLLYCLDRSEQEYTIQMDADTLTVGDDIQEVLHCIEANLSFTISDGFSILPLLDVSRDAQVPSDYIGLVAERKFEDYPNAEDWRYVRGSSGFAGFSRGGFTREKITRFHEIMEKAVGVSRWREWGTEQCGSNFAIANSPGAVTLPFPDYQSFIPNTFRQGTKFFHFIGSFRMNDDYFAARGQRIIAELRKSHGPSLPVIDRNPYQPSRSFAFARSLTLISSLKYFSWWITGRFTTVLLRRKDGLTIELRPHSNGDDDYALAYEVFINQYLLPRVWIPRVRVHCIVDLGAKAGFSSLYWLAKYHLCTVVAFEAKTKNVTQFRANINRNGYNDRVALYAVDVGVSDGEAGSTDDAKKSACKTKVVDLFQQLGKREIDILKVDIDGDEYHILADPRFARLNIKAMVLKWHARPDIPNPEKWFVDQLTELGFRLYPIFLNASCGMLWAYRNNPNATGDSLRWLPADLKEVN